MQRSLTVVLYGHDEMLNYTRAAILQRAGFNALRASSLNNLIVLTITSSPDLFIFCQTVSPPEQSRLTQIARKLRPASMCLSMADLVAANHADGDGAVESSFISGRHLIDVVERLTHRQTPQSEIA